MTQISIHSTSAISSLGFGSVVPVDLSAFDLAGDYISLALPEFPIAKLDLEQTFIDFTSNPIGDFGIGPTDSLAFSQGEALEGEEKDFEIRLPISLLSTVDRSAITGVRFRIFATEECDFRCLSIRACSEHWEYAPVDMDTLWDRIHRPPTPDGSKLKEHSLFEELPIVFRSNELGGFSDPTPVNLSVGAVIRAGSFAEAKGTNKNEFAMFFRDVPTDNRTQIELDSMTQQELEAYTGQPDFGRALYDTKSQEDLDVFQQEMIDARSQFDLERKPDESEHSWIEVKLKWGEQSSTNKLTIFDADEVGYTFENIAFEASSSTNLEHGLFWMIVDLEDSTIRVRIYQIDQTEQIKTELPVLDTGVIYDDNLLKKRKGRFGWWTNLRDGDAHIDSIRSRGTNFGEMMSKEFRSITPIKGVSLYAGSTADHELVSGVEPTSEFLTLSLDPSASNTGKAIKVTTTPLKPLQGVATNPFLLDDPNNIRISLDLKFPGSEIPGGGLSGFLLGEDQIIRPVNLSSFTKGIWTHIKVSLKEEVFQTGTYQFVLMQSFPVVTTNWWIENMSVKTYSVKWSARPHKSDAWNTEGDRWQDAGFTLNSLNGGIVFDEIGNGLQVRAQALRQDAEISEFKAIPQYATLGRLVFRDESTGSGSAPSGVTIEATVEGVTVNFKGSATDSDGSIVSYLWSFGDETYDVGKTISHTYANNLTDTKRTVTLTVKDDFGNAASAQKVITLSP